MSTEAAGICEINWMPIEGHSGLPMRALLAGARRKQADLIDLAKRLVLAESPSDDKAAVDACVDLAAAHGKALGGRVKRHRQRGSRLGRTKPPRRTRAGRQR